MTSRRGTLLWLILFALSVPAAAARGDEYTYIDEDGQEVTVEAELYGNRRGFQALLRRDGQLQLVPTAAIRDRKVAGDITPFSVQEMEALIRERFGGAELVRSAVREDSVVALVLDSPLPRAGEQPADRFVKKAVSFMENVDQTFEKYARSLKLPLHAPRFPLVLVIFESDDAFDKFAAETVGEGGLSAGNILGFYSLLTNWLAVRMSSCDNFEVPLHEAIHLQVYNRLLPRLADIPQWFSEGIATGFEGTGERVNTNPRIVNTHYARLFTQLPADSTWASVVRNDNAFTSDVMAGDAYTMAWGLHWMLVSNREKEYVKYVTDLSKLEPLVDRTPQERQEHFESTFGASLPDLEKRFYPVLDAKLRSQKLTLADVKQAGRAREQQALLGYQIDAVSRADLGGRIYAAGAVQNTSVLRPMTFYVALVAGDGSYADWLLPDVPPLRTLQIEPQVAAKRLPGGGNGDPGRFRIFVKSTAAGSEQAAKWKSGELPVPQGL